MAPSLEELTGRAAKAEAEIEELVAELEKMKRGRWQEFRSCYCINMSNNSFNCSLVRSKTPAAMFLKSWSS